jgi:ubiquinone biosynthesis protein
MKRFFEISRGLFIIMREYEKGVKSGDFQDPGLRINKELTRLGPTFIKIGQMLSLRPDLVPPDLTDELRKLLDHGTPAPTLAVRELFHREIGKYPEDVFDSFSVEPFAVASLAQVHHATRNKKQIAVKIQKPGVEELIVSDVQSIKFFLRLASWVPKVERRRDIIQEVITEFFGWMHHELDYRIEALNMSRMQKNFSGIGYFKIPTIVYTLSTKRILVMEYIPGPSLNEIFDHVSDLASKSSITYDGVTFEKKIFLDHAAAIVFKQVFEDGFFHADPHPANIIIASSEVTAYIDFGITGILSDDVRKKLLDMMMAVMGHDVAKITSILVSLDEIEGHADNATIESQIRDLLNEWQGGTLIEMSTAEMFYRLMHIALNAKINLPLSLVIFGKAMVEYEGDLRKFEPQLDFLNSFKPYAEKLYGVGRLGGHGSAAMTVKELLDDLEALPHEAHHLLDALKKDGVELTVRFGPAAKVDK